ncbi:MAG: copper-binding protein [Comamonadaceae bacterium]|nr:MAG: copper-binding protein [Comamonadaceae bacterium]
MQVVRYVAIAAVLLGVLLPSQAQQPAAEADHGAHHAPAAPVSTAVPQSEGEVRRVDRAAGKVTLRHGPLLNLDMPAMTMVFTAADRRLLDGLKVGDKVRFTADRQDETYRVTAIQPAP